jgi:hypothetical protein
MATYYVGSGGNDGNSGLTWALRKLTLNGAEDVPVVANDTVYVGPGVYREMLTVDVSGGAGTEITYIGDVSGEHTDGIGGVVRITGSDNDQSAARNYCITANTKDYRIFRGFSFDVSGIYLVFLTSCSNITIQDCTFHNCGSRQVYITGASQLATTLQRCVFMPHHLSALYFQNGATVDDTGHVVENCIFLGNGDSYSVVRIERIGDITFNHILMAASGGGIRIGAALTVGQTINVYNSILQGNGTGLRALVLGEIIENYNTFAYNGTDRANVNVGANSVTYPALFRSPILLDGYIYPWWIGELSEWSQVRAIAGTSMATDDLLGMTRPVTDSKKSWGAVQYQGQERDTATTYDASTASLTFPDAGRVQFKLPTADSTEITISCYCYREANYAGVNPQMIIKQPGQADDTTTDAAAASQWNLLTTTLTPADEPDYVFVELVSSNTAVAGNYAAYFDALSVDSSPTLGDLDNWLTDRVAFEDIQAAGASNVTAPIFGPSTIMR